MGLTRIRHNKYQNKVAPLVRKGGSRHNGLAALPHKNIQKSIKSRKYNTDTIFPFRFNLSQKAATEKAFRHSVTVIEGPPGTGKTQTILNILANLITIQGKSVAVVSNNNEAVKNVHEKLEENGYEFLVASLGNSENQKAFFANMPKAKVDEWDCEESVEALMDTIHNLTNRINDLLKMKREMFRLEQERRGWELELKHFEEYYNCQNLDEINKLPLIKENADKILDFLVDTSLAKENKKLYRSIYRLEFIHKLRLLYKYGLFNYKKLKEDETAVLLVLQKEYYKKRIVELEEDIDSIKSELVIADFKRCLDEHQHLSEKLFRKYLYNSHHDLPNKKFTIKNFKLDFREFIKRYPIILSTTYSLRRSIPENFLLDYVIIDEASQVDLCTGALAFSCCKNVVIVGDEKQLPQIVNKDIEAEILEKPESPVFNYFSHNILSSMRELYQNKLPCTTLREHYRCHPQIIEFCNQKYYDEKLIACNEKNFTKQPLILYRTALGNHMRKVTRGNEKGSYNQRELDVVEEILHEMEEDLCTGNKTKIGFVTPYRKQADKAGKILGDNIESDTVHKYQGREKDVMIMSTVLDNTRNGHMGLKFVDDPHMVNVAVSRAAQQFILVTDNKFFIEKGKEINALIRYIRYNTLDMNIKESRVVSVFDLLYKEYSDRLLELRAKMDITARFQSEEAMRVLVELILDKSEFSQYQYRQGVLVKNIINNLELLTGEELHFINNRASLDFVIYRKQDKSCALVIEVDGFEYHENNPEQLKRDRLKDAILEKYNIPLLRLPTNGSREQGKIEAMLRKIEEERYE